MKNSITSLIAGKLNIDSWQVDSVLKLSADGCTIPFISRYRKEATGNLDEVAIKAIIDTNQELLELNKRREFIINAITQLDKLTPELLERINKCDDLTALEDIYMPFKPKKQTRAEMARKKGLEPLAKIIMAQNMPDISAVARKFVNKEVADSDAAIAGALDIIAEWVSESEAARNQLRNLFTRAAVISASVIKGKEEDGAKYNNYFDFSKPLKYIGSHQLLAIRRAENEGILRISIDVDSDEALSRLGKIFIKSSSASRDLIEKAIKDSFKRLLKPSIENEFAASSKTKANESAISTFSDNLRQLLMAAPLIGKRILAIDPGYRTGCKIVCLDENGALLYNDSIFPNPPQKAVTDSMKKLSRLVETYKIDAISLGNGTASRETEDFLTKISFPRKVQVYVVNESGASIYSASPLARREFPDKDVTVRGAVSIGRRLLDPLAELVKIDARSIGVGQYQHDVDQGKLKDALDFVVDMCVNRVGVNVNTASEELLSHVSGIGPSLAANIVKYRNDNGKFISREDLKQVPRLGAKAFEQCAGFLRIPDAVNPLDNSAVHPESYHVVEKIATILGKEVKDIIGVAGLKSMINVSQLVNDSVGEATINDILDELEKPGRDPRNVVKIVEFDSSIKQLSDIKIGMILNGVTTNITQFGVFVDVGIKENGLVHISEISNSRISSPVDVVKLNQPVKVRVIGVDTDRHRLSLSMKIE